MPTKGPKFRDPHLWTQSALTIAGTVAVSLALAGALSSPATLGEPTTQTTILSTTHSEGSSPVTKGL